MTDSPIVAIHQPNFFPWLGYFNKIARSDLFIVLDNVQFPKTGGTWMNRVRLLVDGKPKWVTMPLCRTYQGVRIIRDVEIDNQLPWRARLLNTLRQYYSRAPYYQTVFSFLETVINNATERLTDFNLKALRALSRPLGMDPGKWILGTSLSVEGSATELLITMVKAVGGNAYLCGGGADGYQEDRKFSSSGIGLVYQGFEHPVYSQQGKRDFVPGLSIIDALMHCGFEQTRDFVWGQTSKRP